MSALLVSVEAVTPIGPEERQVAGLTVKGATTKLSAKRLVRRMCVRVIGPAAFPSPLFTPSSANGLV